MPKLLAMFQIQHSAVPKRLVVLSAVRRRSMQMRAKEHKCTQKGAYERKSAKSAKERKRAQKSAKAHKHCKQPGLTDNQVWELPKHGSDLKSHRCKSLRLQLRFLHSFSTDLEAILVAISLALCDSRSRDFIAKSNRWLAAAIAIFRFGHLSMGYMEREGERERERDRRALSHRFQKFWKSESQDIGLSPELGCNLLHWELWNRVIRTCFHPQPPKSAVFTF